MRLLIDGDACPNKEELYQLALDYNIEMIVFCDYSHIINGEYETIYCDVGHDEVDQIIYKEAHRDDIIITQDYGLASLLILKGASVIHVNGFILDEDNIYSYLASRYESAKARRSKKKIKQMKKRSSDMQENLLSCVKFTIESHN
ncbi:hypothetical protein SAMN04487759_1148 [Kandleria vitulina]|uniref:Uncharacterized protein n=1 Tax=Kandleria vitulina TaxID=1630 RepID=A0A1H2THW2_9FIRM|nr:DUF188 domain-containing protein [Kandleria vitulina]SDW43533.1 hypothetical protein SAMN04487759_1148 [Kandleria vitulina]